MIKSCSKVALNIKLFTPIFHFYLLITSENQVFLCFPGYINGILAPNSLKLLKQLRIFLISILNKPIRLGSNVVIFNFNFKLIASMCCLMLFFFKQNISNIKILLAAMNYWLQNAHFIMIRVTKTIKNVTF